MADENEQQRDPSGPDEGEAGTQTPDTPPGAQAEASGSAADSPPAESAADAAAEAQATPAEESGPAESNAGAPAESAPAESAAESASAEPAEEVPSAEPATDAPSAEPAGDAPSAEPAGEAAPATVTPIAAPAPPPVVPGAPAPGASVGDAAAPAAAATAAADPAAPDASAQPRPRPDWAQPRTFGMAALSAAIGVGFAVAAAIVLLVATQVILLFSGAPGGGDAGGDLPTDQVQIGGVPFLAPIIWLTTLGLFGQLSAGLDISVMTMSGSVQLAASLVPVGVLIAGIVGTAWWSYREERAARSSSRAGVWALAGTSALAGGILTILIALMGRTTVSVGDSSNGGVFEVSTISAATFFGPLAVIGLSAVLGRWLARGAASRHFGSALWHAPSRFRWGTRDVYDYVVVLTLIAIPVSFVAALIAGNGLVSAWPVGVGVLGVLTTAVGHLGGYTLSASIPGDPGASTTLSLFGDISAWAWLLVLFAVIGAVLAGVLIARRRLAAPVPLQRAWVLPVGTLAVALVIGLTLGGTFAFGGFAMAAQAGAINVLATPAIWTYLVALVWGAAVEASARYLAPLLLSAMPFLRGWKVAGDGTDAAPVVPAEVEQKPLSPKAKRGLLIGGIVAGAVVVIAVVGGIVISTLQNGVFSPRTTVQAYLDDIAAGRFADASKAAGIPADEDAMLGAEKVDLTKPISAVRVGEPTGAGDTRSVPVTFRVDGEQVSTAVAVQSTGKQFLVFDDWAISDGLDTPVSVYGSGLESIVVGGVTIPLEDENENTFLAYPGVYPVTGGESEWTTIEATSLTVRDFADPIDAQAEPTDALTEEVQKQVDAALDECAASNEANPGGCPLSVWAYGDTRNVKWTIVEYPTVQMQGLEHFWAENGEATVTFEQEDLFGDGWQKRESTDSIYVGGDVAIDGDTVTVTLQDF